MTAKKPHAVLQPFRAELHQEQAGLSVNTPPTLYRVERQPEQAILSVCSVMMTSSVAGLGDHGCRLGGLVPCKRGNAILGMGDSGPRPS